MAIPSLSLPFKTRFPHFNEKRAIIATRSKITRNKILKVAQHMDDAITSIINPISSGSLMGVRNRTIDKAPKRPKERGKENWMHINMAVTAIPRSGNDLCT